MWGGKFNLGKFKIYGAWHPMRGKVNVSLREGPPYDFLDYKDLLKKEIRLNYNRKTDDYFYPTGSGPYYMKDFVPQGNKKMLECAELIIQDFGSITIGKDIHTYEWTDCTLKMICYENQQEDYFIKNANVILTQEELNRYNIKININRGDNQYKIPIYQTYKIKQEDSGFYEKYKTCDVQVGEFYIVQDRNYNNFNLSDTIYPIDYGIKNATVFDRIEKCTAKRDFAINFDQNLYSYNCSQLQQYKNKSLSYFINPMTTKPYECNCQEFTKSDGTKVYGDLVLIRKNQIYYKWTRDVARPHQSLGQQIIVDTKHYPGCFRLVGETRSRRYQDGVDERFQFEIPLCKLNSSNSFTFAAEGEPTTYNMSFKALRNSEGVLMKLTQYEVKEECKDNYSHIAPYNTYIPEPEECCDKDAMAPPSEEGIFMRDPEVKNCYKDWLPHRGCHYVPSKEIISIVIINPPEDTVFTVDKDLGNPYNGESPYLKLPETIEVAELVEDSINNNNYDDKYRNILLIQVNYNDSTYDYLTEENIGDIEYDFIEGDGQ